MQLLSELKWERKDSEGGSRDRLFRRYKDVACEYRNGVRKDKAHQELKQAEKVKDKTVSFCKDTDSKRKGKKTTDSLLSGTETS